jgi:hypothetical protein
MHCHGRATSVIRIGERASKRCALRAEEQTFVFGPGSVLNSLSGRIREKVPVALQKVAPSAVFRMFTKPVYAFQTSKSDGLETNPSLKYFLNGLLVSTFSVQVSSHTDSNIAPTTEAQTEAHHLSVI